METSEVKHPKALSWDCSLYPEDSAPWGAFPVSHPRIQLSSRIRTGQAAVRNRSRIKLPNNACEESMASGLVTFVGSSGHSTRCLFSQGPGFRTGTSNPSRRMGDSLCACPWRPGAALRVCTSEHPETVSALRLESSVYTEGRNNESTIDIPAHTTNARHSG